MSRTSDPAVVASKAFTRARYLAGQVMGEFAIRRAEQIEDGARAAFLEAVPTTAPGARLHVLAAWRERHLMEEHAAEGAREYRRQAGGRWAATWARGAGADAVDLDKASRAARKIRGAARLLARRRQAALPLLRQALEVVRAFPLPDADNAAIERHLELALAFLARPRAV